MPGSRRASSSLMLLCALSLLAHAAPARAQAPTNPDFSNVGDILQGRRTLFPVDDIVVSFNVGGSPTIDDDPSDHRRLDQRADAVHGGLAFAERPAAGRRRGAHVQPAARRGGDAVRGLDQLARPDQRPQPELPQRRGSHAGPDDHVCRDGPGRERLRRDRLHRQHSRGSYAERARRRDRHDHGGQRQRPDAGLLLRHADAVAAADACRLRVRRDRRRRLRRGRRQRDRRVLLGALPAALLWATPSSSRSSSRTSRPTPRAT